MILYVNGDSHTAAAEAVNAHAFAEDDSNYWHLARYPHPDNLAVSWGKLLADRLKAGFHCGAESASSNDRIIRTTNEWISQHQKDLYRTLIVIQWSTYEREEWQINGDYYQVNASGIDQVPSDWQDRYKQFVANIDWTQKTIQAHQKIWDYHLSLKAQDIKHVFFNGNSHFESIQDRKDWENCYMDPYNPDATFHSVLSKKVDTVTPASWHYGADGHRVWANYILHYLIDNQLV